MDESPHFALGARLEQHALVDAVQASKDRITVAHVADHGTEALPQPLFEFIMAEVSDTEFIWEAGPASPELVEVHLPPGGRSKPLTTGLAPRAVELQAHLVR